MQSETTIVDCVRSPKWRPAALCYAERWLEHGMRLSRQPGCSVAVGGKIAERMPPSGGGPATLRVAGDEFLLEHAFVARQAAPAT